LERSRPTINGSRQRILYGIELTDDAHELAELAGKFTIEDE